MSVALVEQIHAPAPKYGECTVCRQTVRQTMRGVIHAHRPPSEDDAAPSEECPGGAPLVPTPKKRRRYHRTAWYRELRSRMLAGLEHCRNPGCQATDHLTIDHIVPTSLGGSERARSNFTILCASCNAAKGTDLWPHLRSLTDEDANRELAAQPG